MKNEFTQNAQPGSHEGNSTNGEEKEDAFQEAAIQLLSCLFEHATESVLVLNTRATILYINPSCASMLKSGEQPLTGIPFESLLYEGQLLTWHDILAQALRQKDYPIATSFTLTIRAREGAFQQTYLSCSARLVYREFPMLASVVLLYVSEVKIADFQLHDIRLSESNLHALLDTTPQAYFLLDPSYKILQFNSTAQTYVRMIWGKNLKEGDSMLEYANPANREAFEKNFGIALQGKCISSERHLHYPNGQSIWYEIHYIPVLSQQGQVEAVVFTGLDITKQKEDENIVKKLSLVAQKTSNMVVITDKNGLTEWVNEGFVRITGYSLQEAQGKTPGQLLQGPLSDQSTIDYMSECRQRGERFEAEIVNYRKDGTPYWLSISASPVYAENAGLTGFIAIQSDITEKKTLQAQTIQHLSTLNAILSSSKDGICALDTSYRYLTFNEVYANNIKKMFGIELQVGMDALETLTANENFAHVKKDWDRALRGESLRKEETLKISDEEVVYLEVSFNPIFKNQKEIMGVAIFIKDITMHKQAEKHLLRQNEQLQKINEQLDKFVYRAGHDLRAPLVSVLGLINIAQLETDASAKDAYMEMMKKSIAKLDHFIQDIIYFSRNSRTTLSYDQISFEPFMDDILAALMHTREEKPIEFRVDIRQEEEFYSDSKRLSVVLNNLIANAIKYSNPYKETPYVAIQVSVTSEQAFISISDNGIGIEKEHIGRIFDMFYRATETKSGSGLGLSIVKETLEKLGGRIQVESQWGEGTRFTLEVPNRYRKN